MIIYTWTASASRDAHTQLLGSGTPLESKLVENYTRSEAQTGQLGIPGMASGTVTGTDADSSGTERRFDLGWLTVLQTIDELSRRGYIRDDTIGVPVGSIVRVHGLMQLVDLRIMRDMWTPMTKIMRTQGGNKKRAAGEFNPGAVAELAKFLPHPLVVQLLSSSSPYGEPMTFGEESVKLWGMLAPQNVVGTADTFSLMNGGIVPGDYVIIGVLDAGAGEVPDVETLFPPTNTFNFMLSMQQTMREMFGRSDDANGITPLLIYRSLARKPKES